MKKLLIILFAILILAGQAWAVDRYCDCANDGTGTGAVGSPWPTLAAAVAGSTAGDTVYITTNCNLDFGSINKSLNFKGGTAAVPAVVTMTPVGTLHGTIGATGIAVTFENLTFDSAAATDSFFRMDGTNASATFTNCTFVIDEDMVTGIYTSKICTMAFDSCTFTVTADLVNSSYGSMIYHINGGTCSVTNSTISMIGGAYYYFYLQRSTGGGILIYTNNTVTYDDMNGGFLGVAGVTSGVWTITGNAFTQTDETSAKPVIAAYASNTTLAAGSVISNNKFNTAALLDGASAFSVIQIKNTAAGGVTIDNNYFNHKNVTGYVIALGSDSCTSTSYLDDSIVSDNFIECTAVDTARSVHSIMAACVNDPVIERNYIKGSGAPIVVKGVSGISGGHVRDNVIDGLYHLTTTGGQGITLKGASGVYVYGNTLYSSIAGEAGESRSSVTCSVNDSPEPDYAANTNTIRNNIAYFTESTGLIYYIELNGTGTNTGNTISNNLFYDPSYAVGTDRFYSVNDAKTSAEWAVLGYGSGDAYENPDLLDPANGDFRLRYDSPAINAGINLGDSYDRALHPLTDWSDLDMIYTVDQDNFGDWEIGAYAYPEGTCGTLSGVLH